MYAVGAVYVNWKPSDGETALMLGATAGHSSCVKLLLKHGADVNHRDSFDEETPLLRGKTMLLFSRLKW